MADVEPEAYKYLPQRPPFAFVDEFETSPDGETTRGSRTFRDDEFFFAGHFPGHPVVPGVILIETLAQCGGCGIAKSGRVPKGCNFLLASIKEAKFHQIVRPGDKFEIEITTEKVLRNRFIMQSGRGRVNGVLAIEAVWVGAITNGMEGL
jgi:3-hydroxyacyl-[acyl-carrier-protein] dehydratase